MKEVNNSSFKGINILNNKKNIRRFFVLDGCYSYPWDEFFIRIPWDVRSYKPTHLFSDAPRRCIRRTTTDWRPYRSSHVGCWFGRSGSSGFVVDFCLLRWCGFDKRNRMRAYRNTLRQDLRFCPGYGLLIRKESNEGHLKVMFQTTLWFSFVLTQPTY